MALDRAVAVPSSFRNTPRGLATGASATQKPAATARKTRRVPVPKHSWGRLATRTQGTYSATYGYRYGGRLYNFTSNFPGEAAATFEYRGDGRLHRRTVGTDIKVYRYDAGWNAINTEDNAGALQAASVYEPGQSVGQRLAYSYGSLGTGTVVYAYHDQLGSTRRWRLNKSSLGANEYEPYGEAYAVSTLAPRDYALHEWDPAIAAYRAPYRNYSPAMARWMTRDPLGMVDGPNMYGYVGGRMIGAIDITGAQASEPKPEPRNPCKENSSNSCMECCDQKATEGYENCRRNHPLNWYKRGLCNSPVRQCHTECVRACLADPKMTGADAARTSDLCNRITPSRPENCPTK